MFRKVLIANRGEIAVRVAGTLQQMGIAVVAVYSDPDRGAFHVRNADEAYPLDGKTAAETYLDIGKITAIAKRCGAEAIHPGYGFLSENAQFAQACADAGIVFIGPPADVIRCMGDKVRAKEIMHGAGVPTVPGWSGVSNASAKTIAGEAGRIGYPVLVKAAAGGGGKGMRVVRDVSSLAEAWASAGREAKAAFGDGRVFLEKYIERPRHIEFQVFGDHHGNVVHLFERECSIQRRHQKIIEETPSPALSDALRGRMGEAAVKAARAAGYSNAGTVEFLLSDGGEFYFLEMNTRLQVEHPVTELTTGLDLVRAQLIVADGRPLPFTQDSVRQRGHAIECRIYAEDASRGFLPSTGTIEAWAPPSGPGIRVDAGVARGSEVSVYYDPMLAKLVICDETRTDAIDKTIWALKRFAVLGVTTNVEFLQCVISHPAFRAGDINTAFLEQHDLTTQMSERPHDDALVAACVALLNGQPDAANQPSATHATDGGPWQRAGAWRSG